MGVVVFTVEHGRLVKRRALTQKRLPVRFDRRGKTLPCHYVVGKSYALQVAGQPSDGQRVTVLATREEAVRAILPRDARASGFRTRDAFLAAWTGEPDQVVWVIVFTLGDLADHARLLRASAPTVPICTAIVTVEADGRPRKVKCGRGFTDGATHCGKGHRRPPASAEDDGYTGSSRRAMPLEGEAVSATEQEAFTIDGRARYAGERMAMIAARADLAPAERLRRVERESARLGVDISSERRLIAERLERAERQMAAA